MAAIWVIYMIWELGVSFMNRCQGVIMCYVHCLLFVILSNFMRGSKMVVVDIMFLRLLEKARPK